MPLQNGEHPIVIPRPSGARPGGPAPWELSAAPSAIDELTAALDAYVPVPPDASLIGPHMREAAVLVPFVERDSGPEILITKRPGHMPSHRGELAFPGGGRDDTDVDLWATARREAREEIGLAEDMVGLLSELDTLVTVGSRFVLTPFAGVVDPQARIASSSDEVDRVLSISIARLLEPGVFTEEIWPWPDGEEREIYFFTLDEDDIIWGATARILYRLLEIVLIR
ncbi:MAG: CoA pyrophosphatase [Acidobacteria bacterium]|nr:MAG: CoA pyrophosphatase [Acidobacteriota bacterium]